MEPSQRICDLKRRLEKFPSSFQLTLKGNEKLQRVKKVAHTLASEKNNDPQPYNELRTDNLISYLLYEQGRSLEALELIKCVKAKDPTNIIVRANLINILIYDHEIDEAERELKELESLQEADVTAAKSELAYSFSRFGPLFHKEALKYFEQVTKIRPTEWLWQFGYGLVLQRCLTTKSYFETLDFDGNETFFKALDAFSAVLKHREAPVVIKAKTLTKLQSCIALYCALPEKSRNKNPQDALEPFYKAIKEQDGAKHIRDVTTSSSWHEVMKFCIEESLRIAPNDRTVLQDCGKYYKQAGLLHKAFSCLGKAEKVQPNTVIYAQLADLEVRMWEKEYEEQLCAGGAVSLRQGVGDKPLEYRTVSNTRDIEDLFSSFSLLSTEVQDSSIVPVSQIWLAPVKCEAERVKLDRLEKALKLYSKACDVSKGDVAAVHLQKGRVHWKLNQIQSAISCFKKVINLSSSSKLERIHAHELIGQCYLYRGNESGDKTELVKANTFFFLAVEYSSLLTQQVPFDVRCQYHFTLEDILKNQMNKNPCDKRLLQQCGLFYSLVKEHRKALPFLEEILKSDSTDWLDYLAMFRALFDSGQYHEAVCFLTILITNGHKQNEKEITKLIIEAAIKAGENDLIEGRLTESKEQFKIAYTYAVRDLGSQECGRYDIYICGELLSDNIHFRYFEKVLHEYFGLHCYIADPGAVTPGSYPNHEHTKAADSSDNFLFVILNKNGDMSLWSRDFRYDLEQLRCSVLFVKREFCSFTIVTDTEWEPVGSLRGLSGSPSIPHYDVWQNTKNDGPEFFKLLLQLFRAILTPTLSNRKGKTT